MGSVYKYGLLNIAAASAADSSGRLFGSRDPHTSLPDVLSMSKHRTKDQILWFNDEHILQLRYTTESIWQSPLFQRAWVFQETLLASRTVVFAQDHIHFRCAEEISSERLPTEHPLRKADIIGNAFGKEQRLITSMKYLSRDEIITAWREVVRRYCNTSITRVSDRLVAISAIARYFGTLKQSPYHAGLWGDTFINDMAWFTNDPRGRDDIYVAPSWSWASLCGRQPSVMVTECSLNMGRPLQIPKILEVQTRPSGQEKFGAIDSGWLRIRAPLYYMGHNREDELGSAFYQRYGALGVERFHAQICPDYHWNTDAAPPIIFALPLQLDSTFFRLDVSLLLLAAVTPAENVYRRVGFCLLKVDFTMPNPLSPDSVHLPPSEVVAEFLTRMECRDEDIHSHERNDSGWHTITII
ncbi:hypothetical protein G7054_g9203 [Neopestalotiopsis clavispora]|nr:hypothetical protein G7054_g9203 [Neopestalotiopsis clavispora]